MNGMLPKLLAATALLTLTACGEAGMRELGADVDKGDFGNSTMNNTLLQTGQISYTVALAQRFAAEVPNTINFEFNSAELSDEARAILAKQADFIRQFPEVRFKVFGHTDLVGSAVVAWHLQIAAGSGRQLRQDATDHPDPRTRDAQPPHGDRGVGLRRIGAAGVERQIRRDHLARIRRGRRQTAPGIDLDCDRSDGRRLIRPLKTAKRPGRVSGLFVSRSW
jgi:hypothetical protein